MIEIKVDNNSYMILEGDWIVGTFATVKELREKLRQIINFKYSNKFELNFNNES